MKASRIAFSTVVACLAMIVSILSPGWVAADAQEPVNVGNFARAETDVAIKKVYDQIGFGKLLHNRTLTPLDQQDVIRMNRDTLYSSAVLDLTELAIVTLPEREGRYMSLQVVNQDHYTYAITEPGPHELSEESVGSKYVSLIFRIFIDANDPTDVEAANRLQDQIRIEGGGDGALEVPNWNMEQLLAARGALNTLATLGIDTARAFGTKQEIDPIDHLVLTAAGWGGLPEKNAYYVLAEVSNNDGTPHVLTVKDVPVDAFWSVTVYNADGFIDENALGVYSYNNATARPNDDGSITIHFGACEDSRVNCLPISKGWNFAERMYEPRAEILDGSWSFPPIEPAD